MNRCRSGVMMYLRVARGCGRRLTVREDDQDQEVLMRQCGPGSHGKEVPKDSATIQPPPSTAERFSSTGEYPNRHRHIIHRAGALKSSLALYCRSPARY